MTQDDSGSVLFVHHRDLASPIGTTHPYYLSSELADSREVDVVCRRRDEERTVASENAADLHSVSTGEMPLLSGLLFQVLSTLYVAALALRNEYELTYCSQNSMVQGWIGARLSGSSYVIYLASVPVRQMQDFRDTLDADQRLHKRASMAALSVYARVIGRLLDRADVVVSLTEGIAEVTGRVYDVDPSGEPVVGMGVDVESFSVPRDVDRADGSGEGWTVTYIGTVHATRGLDTVLEAIAEANADVTFRIAGQGPDEVIESLLADARRLDVADRIEWLGFVPHEDIPELLATTDFAVSQLPDIESYRISFPAKLLEYMAAGTMVVATDIRPHRKLITDGRNGFLYDGTAADLAATIDAVVESPEEHDEIRRRARQTAEAHDWEVVVAEFRRAVFGEMAPVPDSPAVSGPSSDGSDPVEPRGK